VSDREVGLMAVQGDVPHCFRAPGRDPDLMLCSGRLSPPCHSASARTAPYVTPPRCLLRAGRGRAHS